MSYKKLLFFPVFLIFLRSFIFPAPLYSPTWGFSFDLPEGYEYTGGDGKDIFSFGNKEGAQFDLAVYYAAPGRAAPYASLEVLVNNVQAKLNNKGEAEPFEYRQKKHFLWNCHFQAPWAVP